MKAHALIGGAALILATSISAQTVKAPSAVNQPVSHAANTVGNAAGVAADAHELPAAVVAGTVPAARPATGGVTNAARAVSKGAQGTGSEAGLRGVEIAPTGALTPERQAREKQAAADTAHNATRTIHEAADPNCNPGSADYPECAE